MFLTSEILNKYNACQEGKDWFARHFPNGAELIDVIRTRHAPAPFLHWGKLHLPTSEDEQRAYYEILKVEQSTNVFECDHICNCDMITNSSDCSNSQYIYNCRNITDSKDVIESTKIEQSQHIVASSSIYSSTKCVNTHNARNSYNILKGSFIIGSHDIYNSSLVTNSTFILNSQNISESGFIASSHDLTHCLFCEDYEGKEYSIFNHQVPEVQWKFIYEEYKDWCESFHLNLFDEWNLEDSTHDTIIHTNYLEMFAPFQEKVDLFVQWVSHLPYYNSSIAYKITLIPKFMQ